MEIQNQSVFNEPNYGVIAPFMNNSSILPVLPYIDKEDNNDYISYKSLASNTQLYNYISLKDYKAVENVSIKVLNPNIEFNERKESAWISLKAKKIIDLRVNVSFPGGLYEVYLKKESSKGKDEVIVDAFPVGFNNNLSIDVRNTKTGKITTTNIVFSAKSKNEIKFSRLINSEYSDDNYDIRFRGGKTLTDKQVAAFNVTDVIVHYETNVNEFRKNNLSEGILLFKNKFLNGQDDKTALTFKAISIRLNDNLNIIDPNTSKMKKYLTTLEDVIKDLWTNNDYGLGESLDFLDIRVDLNIKCNLIIDKEYQAFELLREILASYRYLIYPDGINFVIESEDRIYDKNVYMPISFTFDNTNCKSIKYNLEFDEFPYEGTTYKATYLKQGETDLSILYYTDNYIPGSSSIVPLYNDLKDIFLPGVTTDQEVKYMLDKKTEKDRKILDRCEITTELEGFIPELYSRVDVVREDYYNSQPVSFLPITRFEKNYPIKNLKLKEYNPVQNEQKYDVVFFNEDLPFRDAAPYDQLRVCVLYKDGTKSQIVVISPTIYEKYFNNNFFINNQGIFIDESKIDGAIMCFYGYNYYENDTPSKIKDTYVVESITPTDSFVDGTTLTEVKLNLIKLQ